MKNKKAQYQLYILLGVVTIIVGVLSYNSGYDNGFNEANQSYTKCLENMDVSQRHYQELLSQKDLEIENLIRQSGNWMDDYFDCINKPKTKIIFSHFTFNLIIYNFLIIGISVLLFLNLFKGNVKISFGQKIDRTIEKNKYLVDSVKFVIWYSTIIYILIVIFQFIKNII